MWKSALDPRNQCEETDTDGDEEDDADDVGRQCGPSKRRLLRTSRVAAEVVHLFRKYRTPCAVLASEAAADFEQSSSKLLQHVAVRCDGHRLLRGVEKCASHCDR